MKAPTAFTLGTKTRGQRQSFVERSARLAVLALIAINILCPAIVEAGPPSPVNNSVLSTPQSNSRGQVTPTGFPTGDFTVEGYVYFPSYPPSRECALLQQEGFCEVLVEKESQYVYPYDTFYRIEFGIATGSPGQFSALVHDKKYYYLRDAWHHIAVTYEAATSAGRIFVDGTEVAPTGGFTKTYSTPPSTDAVVGGISNSTISHGYHLDEVRVSSNLRYTGNFTPSGAPFSPDASTCALWHFDDGNGATTFSDASSNGNDLTGANGAVVAVDDTPPEIASITSTTADGVYGISDEIDIRINFSEPVIMEGGDLVVTLETGTTDRQVVIPPFGPSSTVSGTYQVQSGDASPDLDVLNLTLTGGTLQDAAGNAGILAIPAGDNLADNKDLVIRTEYTLTYTAGVGGTISGMSTQSVAPGADGLEVEAVADAGYHFVDWSDGSTLNPRTDTNVTADITVNAIFALDEFDDWASSYGLTGADAEPSASPAGDGIANILKYGCNLHP